MLSAFADAKVEYLLVGAHALAAHGIVRATKDMDLWIRRSQDNAARVIRALEAFGAPMQDIHQADLISPDLIFQIGVPPLRIDIITQIEGVEFDDAWPRHVDYQIDELPVPVLGKAELIRNKRAAGRPQDLADVQRLEGLSKPKP